MGFPGGSDGEESACKVGDLGSQVSLQERYLGGGHGTHSSILAWRIPWKAKPGGPHSIGSKRVGHD